MRYAIISDLHSNRQALKAVLADIKKNKIDEIVCLGDVVGYGPSPVEVLDLARKNVNHFIMGNHDAVVAGRMSPENFNDNAKFLIEWTCSSLASSGAADFFNSVPLVLKGDDLRFSHGEFENPGRFGYVIDDHEALSSFECCPESLLVTGHSHVPGLFVIGNSGQPHWLAPQDFALEEGKRYIVNAGSVGQPRDDDVCASYCIYDLETKDIFFRKVPFDIASFRNDLIKNSLPQTAYFLTLDQTTPALPAKELIEFTPLTADTSVKMEIEVKDLQLTVAELKKSKKRLIILMLLMILIFAAFGTLLLRGVFNLNKKSGNHKIPSLLSEIEPDLCALKIGEELFSMPTIVQKVTKTIPLKNWTVILTNPKLQKVEIQKDDKGNFAFAITSSEESVIEISSLEVPAQKGMKFNATVQFKNIKYNSGYAEYLLQQKIKNGNWKTIVRKEPRNFGHDKTWGRADSLTSEPLNTDCNIRVTIRFYFSGEEKIKNCSLKRKKTSSNTKSRTKKIKRGKKEKKRSKV